LGVGEHGAIILAALALVTAPVADAFMTVLQLTTQALGLPELFLGLVIVPLVGYLRDYATPREARQGLSAYMMFYNEERPHQALGYRKPAETYFAPAAGP